MRARARTRTYYIGGILDEINRMHNVLLPTSSNAAIISDFAVAMLWTDGLQYRSRPFVWLPVKNKTFLVIK